MSSDPRDHLERLGSQRAPGPDPGFVDRTEDRLRAVAATATADGRPLSTTRSARWWVPLPALAAALLVIVGVVLATDSDAPELRLTAAADAVVVHPDGAVEPAVSGLELGEGDVVRTGSTGTAAAGGLVLGPNMAARVVEGRLQVAPGLAEPSVTPTTLRLPDLSTAPEPGERQPSTTSSTTATSAPPPDDGTRSSGQLLLRAHRDRGIVGMAWTRYEGERFAAYLVLRADAPDDPEYREDGSTTVVMVIRDQDQTGGFDREPPTDPRYRVVAVDREGRELARSDAVAPVEGDDGRTTASSDQ